MNPGWGLVVREERSGVTWTGGRGTSPLFTRSTIRVGCSGQTFAGEKLFLGFQLLAADAIPALVFAQIEIALFLDDLPELLRELLVARLGGADEVRPAPPRAWARLLRSGRSSP